MSLLVEGRHRQDGIPGKGLNEEMLLGLMRGGGLKSQEEAGEAGQLRPNL